MSKITSADCVAAIHAHMGQHFAQWHNPVLDEFKRFSKTGTTRVFMSAMYPITAEVEDHAGALAVTIRPIMWWDEELYSRLASAPRDAGEWHGCREHALFEQLVRTHVKPSDFAFVPGYEEYLEAWYAVVVPLSYFRRCGYMWDQHVADTLNVITGQQWGEMQEATLDMAHCASGEQVIRELAGAGLAVDPQFIEFMNHMQEGAE